MEQKRINLVEYVNLQNEKGIPVGHAPKVIGEAAEIVKKEYDIKIFCGSGIKKLLGDKYDISIIESNFHKRNKALMFVSRWKNLNYVFANSQDNDIMWFTNIDWTLFLYLSLKKSIKQKIIVTAYRDIVEDMKGYKSRIRRMLGKICMKSLDKISLYVITNPALKLFDNQITIPDYYYSEKYDSYSYVDKKNQIACLGAMRGTKDLVGVVRHFNGTGIKVLIVGDFMDKEEFKTIVDMADSNIIIKDVVLSFDEYYKLIAMSKYVILPYKLERYKNATSGILLESLFLRSVPIAPKWLLENNKIAGIGYDKLESLPLDIESFEKLSKEIDFNIDEYRMETISDKLNVAIQEYVLS